MEYFHHRYVCWRLSMCSLSLGQWLDPLLHSCVLPLPVTSVLLTTLCAGYCRIIRTCLRPLTEDTENYLPNCNIMTSMFLFIANFVSLCQQLSCAFLPRVCTPMTWCWWPQELSYQTQLSDINGWPSNLSEGHNSGNSVCLYTDKNI